MPADYHTHTPLCHHAHGSPEAFIDAALAAGLTEFGIADHAPVRPEPFDDWRMREADLPAYLDWIDAARNHAAGRLPVRAGLECDWLPGCQPWIESLAARHPWDFLIGSVHYLGPDWDFDNPARLDRWSRTDPDEAWTTYWGHYRAMAASGLFDLLAHPDLIKKFGFLPGGDLARFYEPAIEAIAASGCAIELNTAGWHKSCAEQYPALDFLRLAGSAGIPLVLSSDAHHPAEVARDFPRAADLARRAGYHQTVLFHQRSTTPEPLP